MLPMLMLASRWDVLIAICLSIALFLGGAGFGVLRAYRWRRSPALTESDESAAAARGPEPLLNLPVGPLLVTLPVAVLNLIGPHTPFSTVVAGSWLCLILVATAGFNYGTSVRLAGFEKASGTLVLRRRARRFGRRSRVVRYGVDPGTPYYDARQIVGLALACGLLAVAGTAFVIANRPVVPEVFRAPSAETRLVPALGRVASHLAGVPIRVRCYSTGDWNAIEQAYGPRGGQASSNPPEIELSPGVCDDLLALLSGSVHPTGRYPTARYYLAYAVVALAHETQHMEGISIESQAECYAMQHAVETAKIMGASPAYARELADVYWSERYPTESAEYRSPLCHRGGRLDLRISSHWP
ncbi:MAG: hypothetical protein QOF08_1050 [Gaiellales bacterium]|jgi:hypothetical protein|nr:hypothetical protein [Gaiellales bacterium]